MQTALIPDKMYFRIGEVASLVGVDSHVLRYWESEFGLKTHRSGAGQRLYQKEDLQRLLRIRRLLHDEGYTIAGARRVLDGDLSAAAPSPATAAVDATRIREAIQRLEILRTRIQLLRRDLTQPT